LKFILATTQFLKAGTFTFEFFLRTFKRNEFLLRVHDPTIHILARRRSERRLLGRKIGINKFSGIVFASHDAILAAPRKV